MLLLFLLFLLPTANSWAAGHWKPRFWADDGTLSQPLISTLELPSRQGQATWMRRYLSSKSQSEHQKGQDFFPAKVTDTETRGSTLHFPLPEKYTHADIEWILRPEHAPSAQEMKDFCKAAAAAAGNDKGDKNNNDDDDDDDVTRRSSSFLEFPITGAGKVMLEAWVNEDDEGTNNHKKRVGRFGITVRAGPPHPLILETIQQLPLIAATENQKEPDDGDSQRILAAAIIYMVVEPNYRKRGIGELALQAIAYCHSQVGCGNTLLVADDNGSGKLVEWYERNGFIRAPLLQNLLGSPNAVYGVTMIRPATASLTSIAGLPPDFKIIQQAGENNVQYSEGF